MENKVKTALENYKKLQKRIILDGLLVGLVSGTFAVMYRLMLVKLDFLRAIIFSHSEAHYIGMMIIAFTVLALIAGYFVKKVPLSSGSGIPQIQGELLGVLDMKAFPVLISKFAGGGLANFAGLSLGREGPSIQIGGASGKMLSKFLKKDINEERYMISAGASAGLAAAFNAPIAGTLFALEEMHKNFKPLILVSCLIASVVSDYISQNIFGLKPVFGFITLKHGIPLANYGYVILLGVLCGMLGVLFNKSILKSQKIYAKLPVPAFTRPVIPFITAIGIGFSAYDLLGGGHMLVEKVASFEYSITILALFFVAKLLFTALSYGSSVQGGIFLPVLVQGALAGGFFASLLIQLGLVDASYYQNLVVLGMAGMLTAVVRSPILSIMLVTEMVGNFSHTLPFCIVAIVAYYMAEILKSKPIYESLLENLLQKNVKTEVDEADEEKIVTSFRIAAHTEISDRKLKGNLFPVKVLVVSVKRDDHEFIPNGETVLLANDVITVLCDKADLMALKKYMQPI